MWVEVTHEEMADKPFFFVGQKLWSQSLEEVEVIAVGRVWLTVQRTTKLSKKFRVNKKTLISEKNYLGHKTQYYTDRWYVANESMKDEYFNFVYQLIKRDKPSSTASLEDYQRLADAAAEVFGVDKFRPEV